MFWLVVQELWKRYKIGVCVAVFGILLLVTLHATGWIWTIDTWAKEQLHITGQINPIVLFSLLIGIGMIIDVNKRRSTD